MKAADGFYSIPLLPGDIAARLKQKDEWPKELQEDYRRLRMEFTAAKAEFASWVRRDRDSLMNRTAKTILLHILECVNFDTGRCDPGHQFLADELGISVRTIERTIPKIAESGWLSVTRRGKTATNFYTLRVPCEKIHAILDYADQLRDMRMEERQQRLSMQSDPTNLADHSQSDPTTVRSHDPTEMADHDPTNLAGKPMKRTFEDEPLKKGSCSDGREDTYPRETIPTEECDFGIWIRLNIPDPTKHRDALRLLRERKMTPEALRRLAA
ncbi:helix-turn-helix domain-containing protein [Rhizobium terrae]|uniref:helix-turn-helix domain-containing protein n=1 Tax=Rhizobium terrae TaxID=2171756 RepID=UPI000E3BA55E|nr:helix-turn-helix domain-containing protein [Rhizobium terrae]